jgi:hypothetical protein
MSVKDIYGKEVSRETHMKFSYNPIGELIKQKKMSDREIMDSKPNWSYKDTKVTIPKVKHYPDAYKHQIISFIKSGVRILGYGLLIINLPIAVGVLIFSEVIGVIEELV